ncbi:MAG TPA: LamG domain-containing protein [Acidimicrobiales bacterium]|nr:LamG domain-containing protein [Acidimicrobiales bacterium]
MTIAATNLTASRDSTDASSFSTASVSPTGNDLILVAVLNSKATTPDTPTISGGGVTTWTQVSTDVRATSRLTIFRGVAPASPTPAAIVIDFGGVTQTSCSWSVDDFSGCDTGGTNGSNAIVQAVAGSGGGGGGFSAATSATVTLAAFGSVDNGTYGAFAHLANESTTQGTGFTKLGDIAGGGPATALESQWRSDNDTSVDASWSTSIQSLGIGIELKAATTGTTVTPSEAAVVLAPQSPTIVSGTTVTPSAAAIVLATQAPAISTVTTPGNGSYPAHLIQFAPGIASSAVPSSGDWVDITLKTFAWSTKWGTEDEFTQPGAGTGDLLLDNSAGLFDPDNTSGTYFGKLLPGTWFRILGGTTTANTDVFYGQVSQDGFQVEASQFPDSVVNVHLVDVTEFFSNTDLVSSAYATEVAADTPALWWRLGESSGSTAADASGNGNAGTYAGTAPANSGAGLIVNDDNAAVHFDGVDDAVTGSITLGANFTLELWVNANSDASITRFLLQIGTVYDGIQLRMVAPGDQHLQYRYEDTASGVFCEYQSTAAVFDGATHHIVITQAGATTSLYVDGVEGKTLTSGAPGSVTWPAKPVKVAAGELTGTSPTRYLTGVVDELALYTSALSSARVSAHRSAGTTPWAGDLTSTRLGRILDLIGYSSTQRNIATGNTTMQAASIGGDAWSAMLAIAKTENGSVYIDHQDGGKVRFINRQYRWTAAASVTSQVTIGDGGGAEIPPARIALADDRIVNYSTMQRAGGDAVPAEDAASKTTYRKRSFSETGLLYQTDDESLYRAQRVVTEKKDRHRRVRSVTLEPRKSTHPAWAHVFARKLNDRITVKWRPTYGGTRSYDGWIIGIEQRWNKDSGLSTVFFCAPVPFDTTGEPYWIAGVSAAGVSTRPGY